jgi:hypothetical protein
MSILSWSVGLCWSNIIWFIWCRSATEATAFLPFGGGGYFIPDHRAFFETWQMRTFELYWCVNIFALCWSRHWRKVPANTWMLLMREHLLLVAGEEIKSIHDACLIFKAIRSTINHTKETPSRSFQRSVRFYSELTKMSRDIHSVNVAIILLHWNKNGISSNKQEGPTANSE